MDIDKKYLTIINSRLKRINNNYRLKHKDYKPYRRIAISDLASKGLIDDFVRQYENDNSVSFVKRDKFGPHTVDNIIVGKKGLANIKSVIAEADKKCSVCRETKEKKYFNRDSGNYDGLSTRCRECDKLKTLKYHRSKEGLIVNRYRSQRSHSKERMRPPPFYEFQWFKEWLLNQEYFHRLYDNWVESGFDKDLSPSVDRMDPLGNYTKNNIQLMTWKENNDKGRIDSSLKKKSKRNIKLNLEIKNSDVNYESKKEKNNMATNFLVITESPSKARTIAGFLGAEYALQSSMGHIRQLSKKYDFKDVIKEGCNPTYENMADKISVIKNLRNYINKDTVVYLASDEDREGEAIAWHLAEVLKLDPAKAKRIVFHEITKPAIMHALEHPRTIDMKIVEAQKARQVLDKGVGYGLSPVLWSKVQRKLSAGRVQSVAVRLVVERENEIRAFVPDEFWKFKALFSNPDLRAELNKKDNKVIKMEISNKEKAEEVEKDLLAGEWELTKIEDKDSFRNPPPPFTTSTLQQTASNRLGFAVDTTMRLAQQLYEGNFRTSIPNHQGGLITYMRTDALNLSNIALDAIKEELSKKYGKEYTLPSHRKYSNKSKGAQEAHEACRPTNASLHPEMLTGYLDDFQLKLYTLIWNRTMATQMPPAKIASTTYTITAGVNKNYEFVSRGSRIKFPGFLLLGDLKDDVVLPSIEISTKLNLSKLDKEQSFTLAPPRYTEASFVKKLEDLGIGRPSTYASTISTIQKRKYVEMDKDKKFVPTDIGEATNKFLVENFPGIVSVGFTSDMEANLDKIATGELDWKKTIEDFAKTFMAEVSKNVEDKNVNYHEVKTLGIHPETKLPIKVMILKFGPTLMMGSKEAGNVKFASIPPGKNSAEITMDEAVTLFKLPREVIVDENKGKLAFGRFGPYLAINAKYYSIPRTDDILTVLPERLKEIMIAEDLRKANMPTDKPKFVKKQWGKKK